MKSDSLVAKTLTVCGIVLAAAAVAGLLFVSRSLLPLIFGAVLIAVVLNRLAVKVGAVFPNQLPRKARIALLMGTLSLLSVVCIYAFANSASEQILQLTDRVDASVETVLQAAKEQPLVQRYLGDDQDVRSVLPGSAKSLGLARNFFATTFGGLADCLILVILSAYFAFNPGKYREGVTRLLPIDWREKFSSLLDESATTLWRWMIGRLLAMILVGLLFGIGLAAIGIPMPLELGVFAALVTFIPNIGGIAAVIPALLLALQQQSSAVISVLLLYLAIQFIESYLITPMVQEHQVSLPPAVVILTQIIAGLVFGFWGIVFSTPLAAIGLLWINRIYVENYLERPA